jgi:hypothetical protein
LALVDVADCDSVSDSVEQGALVAYGYLRHCLRAVDYLPEAGFGLADVTTAASNVN